MMIRQQVSVLFPQEGDTSVNRTWHCQNKSPHRESRETDRRRVCVRTNWMRVWGIRIWLVHGCECMQEGKRLRWKERCRELMQAEWLLWKWEGMGLSNGVRDELSEEEIATKSFIYILYMFFNPAHTLSFLLYLFVDLRKLRKILFVKNKNKKRLHEDCPRSHKSFSLSCRCREADTGNRKHKSSKPTGNFKNWLLWWETCGGKRLCIGRWNTQHNRFEIKRKSHGVRFLLK